MRLEGFQSPLERQQEVLEQVDRKHRQKEELHGRINRTKLPMAGRSPSPIKLAPPAKNRMEWQDLHKCRARKKKKYK